MRLVRNSLVICELTCKARSFNLLNLSVQVPISSFDAVKPQQQTPRSAGHWNRAAIDFWVRRALIPVRLTYSMMKNMSEITIERLQMQPDDAILQLDSDNSPLLSFL